jgi:peptidoglycan/LPS O-acetylase OafA/YrhL
MIGALGGILFFERPAIIKLKLLSAYPLQLLAVLLIMLFVYFSGYGKFGKIALPFGNLIISLSILFLIFAYIQPSNRVIYKILNHKIVVHIGVLSYSLYIWQQFFITAPSKVWYRIFPYNILLIYIVAITSYYLLEQPLLRIKDRLLKAF